MRVIPAMDIREGKIAMGPRDSRMVYPSTPEDVASHWNTLCIRDREGHEKRVEEMQVFDVEKGKNCETVKGVKKSAPQVAMSLGSGIRSMKHVEHCAGVADRLIIGGVSIKNTPTFLSDAETIIGRDRLVFAVDFQGYDREFGRLCDYCKRHGEHARYILLTARKQEGRMTGPDLELYDRVSAGMRGTETDIIAAGGVRCPGDIRVMRTTGVYGVVVGRVLYEEGFMNIEDALAI